MTEHNTERLNRKELRIMVSVTCSLHLHSECHRRGESISRFPEPEAKEDTKIHSLGTCPEVPGTLDMMAMDIDACGLMFGDFSGINLNDFGWALLV